MSRQVILFFDYIHNYATDNTTNFKRVFKNRLSNIENKSGSSKCLINSLYITQRYEFKLFKMTYMDYFRMRMNVDFL
jgi:hypothetical protein